MSQHSSFGGKGKIRARRNVLKRYEKLRVLKGKNAWAEGKSVFGLPKIRAF